MVDQIKVGAARCEFVAQHSSDPKFVAQKCTKQTCHSGDKMERSRVTGDVVLVVLPRSSHRSDLGGCQIEIVKIDRGIKSGTNDANKPKHVKFTITEVVKYCEMIAG